MLIRILKNIFKEGGLRKVKKILFGITSLTIGGAERVLVDLANRLSSEYDITILTIYGKGEMEKQLNEKVKLINLYDMAFKDYNKIDRMAISLDLMFKIKPPEGFDVYIAFLEGPITRLLAKKINGNNKLKNENTILSSSREKASNLKNNNLNENIDFSFNQKDNEENEIKRIAWVHNDISKVFGNSLKAKIKKYFDKKAYRKYDKIVFVSEENKKDFEKTYGNIKKIKSTKFDNGINKTNEKIINSSIKKQKTNITKKNLANIEENKAVEEIVIRNYINFERVLEKAKDYQDVKFDKNSINLVSVCRLVDQKAIDRFIKVHSKLEKDGIHSKVYIIGDGPNKSSLEKLIEKYNEKDNFFLLGQKENPYPYIKNADYFCLLSYYEGYGMVVDEAKILEKRIIITDTAAKEGLENYKNSYILDNNEKAIYEGLKKILSSDMIVGTLEQENNAKEYYDEIIKNIEKLLS